MTPSSEKQATELAYLTRFMTSLHEDQEQLKTIQAVYDNLTLLGQLLCAGTDITVMRNDFNALATVLLDQLARELRKKTVQSLASKARVAINILIRNLFERTADIGFLATDHEIRAFTEAAEALAADPALAAQRRGALRSRFAEYVQKYSVYHNIMLFATDGTLLVQLDEENRVTKSNDPLIGESLLTPHAYVETFRATDVLPDQDSPLVYSYRVMSDDGTHPVGVLCLCFRFQDECERIFGGLVSSDDWNVITLLSPEGRIIASSDIYQFPVGAKLERIVGDECRIVRFAGREYLATTCETQGYQGYRGPGWVGHVLAPLNHAFEMAVAHEIEQIAPDVLLGVLEKSTLFSQALRDIPVQAANIQNQLNRAVWNGNLWLSRDNYAMNTSFAKVLLWEIGSTGTRTRNVFIDSTTNLYETVVSSLLSDCAAQASLAIDIMDRNLYERANDCRWWALTSAFRETLAALREGRQPELAPLTTILRTINGLYTVYSNLVLFDANGRIVAVSNPLYGEMIGQTLRHDWARQTLALPDTASYCVSPFEASPLYGGRSTYIYSAAIRESGTGTEAVGGIAIVFDAAPQFAAMLSDALPRKEDGSISEGAFAVFAETDGTVIASTDDAIVAGSRFEIPSEFLAGEATQGRPNIIVLRDRYYAVGSRKSVGYREYKSASDSYRNDVVALILVPLSDSLFVADGIRSMRGVAHESQVARRSGGEDCVEIATFHVDKGWYGVRVEHALETIEQRSITTMPGMPPWVRGCIMHNDQALPVLDLSAFLNAGQNDSDELSAASQSAQIVLIHVPEHQVSYGIVVDRLGEILDVPRARIEPIPQMINDGLLLTESLVRPHADDPGQKILVVLSAERLLRRLTGKESVLAEMGVDLQRLEAPLTGHDRAEPLARKTLMYCENQSLLERVGRIPLPAPPPRIPQSPQNQRQYRARFGAYTLNSHFQPIVSFSYRRVVGLEGLIRGCDDTGRMIAPVQLMAEAEAAGSLVEIDRLARRLHVANYSALQLAEGWLFLNMHPSVFSGMPSSTERYFQTPLSANELPPSRVVIEILEDSVKDDAQLRDGVAILRQQGWGIALDDFGAGHSNFDRVWEVKPDIVKLDRSYAVRAARDPAARRMLPSIVALLHEAGSLVLLEGIETAEQAMIAMDADIDLAQGFYFARPGEAQQVAGFAAGRVVDDLWPVFEELRRSQRDAYKAAVDPSITALGTAAQALADGQSMSTACANFLLLEQSDRCYLLNREGFQVGRNVLAEGRAATPALAGYQQTSLARWSHRPYFQRALAHPGRAQITRPYRSMATTCLCVTVSVSLLLDGETHVLCGDLLWKDS